MGEKWKVVLHQKDLRMTDNLLVSQQIAFSKILLQAFSLASAKKQNPFKKHFFCALVAQYFSKWEDIWCQRTLIKEYCNGSEDKRSLHASQATSQWQVLNRGR